MNAAAISRHTAMKPHPSAGKRQQRGAILVISLIMLVIVTLISLSVIRSATVEERIAGSMRDRDKAFQAAEAALRICLARLSNETYTGTSPTVQTPAAAGTPEVWAPDSANWSNDTIAAPIADTSTGVSTSAFGLSGSPRCIYEALGTGTGSYRVTARAQGAQDTTAVILQATYTTE